MIINESSYPAKLGNLDVANYLLDDPSGLREKMADQGYLFFKKLIPPELLIELRGHVTRVLADKGWIRPDRDESLAHPICLPHREGEDEYFRVHDELMKLQKLHELPHAENLLSVMQQVLGESAFPHPLSIIRLVFPNNPEITTPPHQDYRNNQGTPNLTAAWVPLGDCPISSGPLAILEGSHKLGLMELDFHLGPGNRRAILSEETRGLKWLSADFQLGDVLLFPALTVHSALENRHPNQMRLSVDFRYQQEGEALVSQSLQPHFQRLNWDEIYKEWTSVDFQYYWRTKHFELVPWDESLQSLPSDHIKEAVAKSRNYKKIREQRFTLTKEA